ncbi:MAG: hypothetical protein HYZ74_00765 [Elusimicrobia bacterium]|nr:hypothetical protein [Elusimicrobiota bacterium]
MDRLARQKELPSVSALFLGAISVAIIALVMGCNCSQQTPFGTTTRRDLSPEKARELLPVQVDAQDSILQAYSSGGRDQSYAFLIGSTPERIEAFSRRLLESKGPTIEGNLVKEVSRSERPESWRSRDSYPWLPAWWKADDLVEREVFSIEWKRKETGSSSHGASIVLSKKDGVIYILAWNT